MRMPFHLSFNAILVILIGVGCLLASVFAMLRPEFRILAVGLFLTGIGNLLFGATDGFTDPRPIGRTLYRLGAAAFIGGIPILVYALYQVFGG